MTLTLTQGQTKAYDAIMRWMKTDKKIFTLAGFAGTGKTTLINHIIKELEINPISCAYTGKAALAMRERGVENACTIHSTIYKYVEPSKKIATLDELNKLLSTATGEERIDIQRNIQQLNHDLSKPIFILNRASEVYNSPLIIVDEYSMLSADIVRDLSKFGKKILFVGDPGQLEPIEDNGGGCPLKPDIFLKEIMRQALDNPIIRAATQVREQGNLQGIPNSPEFAISTRFPSKEMMQAADQTICGINGTRRRINSMFATSVEQGVKVVCLQNNHDIGIYNGMLGHISKVHKQDAEEIVMDVDHLSRLHVWAGTFTGKTPGYYDRKNYELFDYGYAITCHKAQGSEWDKVLIVNDWSRDTKRWLYTAITRARKACRIYNIQ